MKWQLLAVLLSLTYSIVWADETVPASLIRVPGSVATVFIAETSKAAFHRFDNSNEGITRAGISYMSIGENGVGKERGGDRRTPLGIYFVTEQLDTSRMHEKYGVTAFVLDYPNVLDRQSGKTGDGIWIHGVDVRGGKRPPRDTDGCIALPNDELVQIATQFRSNTTPVIVVRELMWSDSGEVEALRLELEAAVSAWAASLERRDMQAHLSLYSEDFHHWTMNKPEWSALLRETLGRRPITDVTINELLLLADPNDEGLYLGRFVLTIVEDSQTFASTKRLYWRRSASGTLQIVAEDAG